MQAIKDAVHDYIELDALSSELLDTPEIQRLRRIRQLSTVSLVYPSANHTRFEHSLGVYHLASAAADHLDLAPTDARRVRAAALLHDVGHGPYGHQTEGVSERRLGRHPDEVGGLLAGQVAVSRHASSWGSTSDRTGPRRGPGQSPIPVGIQLIRSRPPGPGPPGREPP